MFSVVLEADRLYFVLIISFGLVALGLEVLPVKLCLTFDVAIDSTESCSSADN